MENLPNEEWNPVPNYEGLYEVSNMGRVKRLAVKVKNGHGYRITQERIAKCSTDAYGYRIASLSHKSKVLKRPVHQLVAMVFLGYERNGKMDVVVDHKDNDRTNNKLDNLQLITHRKNCNKDVRGEVMIAGVKRNQKRFNSSIRINKVKVFLGQDKSAEVCGKIYQLACQNTDKYNGNPADFRKYIRSLL